jgi:hypothetical protein
MLSAVEALLIEKKRPGIADDIHAALIIRFPGAITHRNRGARMGRAASAFMALTRIDS